MLAGPYFFFYQISSIIFSSLEMLLVCAVGCRRLLFPRPFGVLKIKRKMDQTNSACNSLAHCVSSTSGPSNLAARLHRNGVHQRPIGNTISNRNTHSLFTAPIGFTILFFRSTSFIFVLHRDDLKCFLHIICRLLTGSNDYRWLRATQILTFRS